MIHNGETYSTPTKRQFITVIDPKGVATAYVHAEKFNVEKDGSIHMFRRDGEVNSVCCRRLLPDQWIALNTQAGAAVGR